MINDAQVSLKWLIVHFISYLFDTFDLLDSIIPFSDYPDVSLLNLASAVLAIVLLIYNVSPDGINTAFVNAYRDDNDVTSDILTDLWDD